MKAPSGRISKNWVKRVVADFHNLHQARYGYAALEAPVTIVNLRVITLGAMPSLNPLTIASQVDTPVKPKTKRQVFFKESNGFIECPIYERETLGLGVEILGPAIVEQPDSTTVIPAGVKVTVSLGGNLILEAIA